MTMIVGQVMVDNKFDIILWWNIHYYKCSEFLRVDNTLKWDFEVSFWFFYNNIGSSET